MRHNQHRLFGAIIGFLLLQNCSSSLAQIIPDSTLSNPSTVNLESDTFTVEGGVTTGTNLFHSFQEFSLLNGTVFFNNSLEINNIITRITGSNGSQIDGLIRANGTANLFLINPNGIQFGANATLDIGGSFISSTGESVLFSEGSEFSATNPQASSILSINVPVGVQLGSTPGSIQVQGNGHTLALVGGIILRLDGAGNSPSGLRVDSGQTLALIGGDLTLDGGIVTAPSGHLELASGQEGVVNFTEEFTFTYDTLNNFGEINFLNQALVDSSGNPGGSIQIQGENIQLEDAATILIQNQGTTPAGNLIINANSQLKVSGSSADGQLATSIINESIDAGLGGNILITTGELILDQGAGIIVQTFGSGDGGNVNIEASESITFAGGSSINAGLRSVILTFSTADGDSGDVTLSAPQVSLLDGSLLGSTSFGAGNGGSLTINATQVEIAGFDPEFLVSPSLIATTFNTGEAGTITIDAEQVTLRNGGNITTSTFFQGKAGSIVINASDLIEISGTLTESIDPTAIISNGVTTQAFGITDPPSGDAGDITLNTPQLNIAQGTVGVSHEGTGNGGTIRINSDAITLDRQGQISASTTSGEGGDLVLTVQDVLLLRNGSTLTTTAGGSGDGGNITLSSDIIALLEESMILAQAVEGAGGNIQISTQGLFLSPDSQISASSQFGVDGVISVTNPEVDTGFGLLELPTDVVDSSQQIIVGCAAATVNSFAITGRGGLPNNPISAIRGETLWQDWSNYLHSDTLSPSSSVSIPLHNIPLLEANSWIINEQGKIELIALIPNANVQIFPHCIHLPK